jgi:hypothetical protein
MARGDKSKYTDRQKRKAEHIEEGYLRRGASRARAAQIGWATVNKEEGGGNKSGSGRGVKDTKVSSRRGGRIGGKAAASRPASARSASAKKAAATRKRNAARKATAGTTKRATRSSATRKPAARKSPARKPATRKSAARKTGTTRRRAH